jgi:hypothetical protein
MLLALYKIIMHERYKKRTVFNFHAKENKYL